MEGPAARFSTDQPPQILTLPFQIDPVDDPPQLIVGPEGDRMNVTPSSRVQLTGRHLKAFDVDTPTQDVWIEVRKQLGAHLTTNEGVKITRFSLAEYLNGKVGSFDWVSCGLLPFRFTSNRRVERERFN